MDGVEEALEFFGIVEIGCGVADLVVHLSKGAAAEAVLACSEI